jgi:phosphoesterase RecJ-like protein
LQEIEAAVPAVRKLLADANLIILITHKGPDGDAIGSLTATALALRQLGKDVILACDDPAPPQVAFLPLVDEVVLPGQRNGMPPELVIVLDCGDLDRLGRSFSTLPAPAPPIINIDHHRTNTRFGNVNIVASGAAATTEMLYHLLRAIDVDLTSDIAQCLLTGLITDTLGFRTSSVTADTVAVGSALMAAGANLAQITETALNVKPLSVLKLYRIGLNNLQMQDGFLWTTVSNEERQETGHQLASSAGLVTMLGNVQEAKIGCVMIEMEERIYVGFRCRAPWDVATLATELGGGGHQFAAGCSLEKPLAAAETTVLSHALADLVRQQAQLETADD